MQSRGPGERLADFGRGQSTVLGTVLLIGIVFAGIGAVVLMGGGALDDLEQQADAQQAVHSMQQLDSRASAVALGDRRQTRVDLGETGTGSSVDTTDSGWLRVTLDNASGETVLANESLGAVVHRAGGVRVAYQGGGVWRDDGRGATLVSAPEFHYRDTTLTLPIVTVSDGGTTAGAKSIVVREGRQEEVTGYAVPLQSGSVNVTVQSEYYRAWGRFFEDRTDGVVVYDADEKTATLRLVTPTERPQVTGAVVSNGAGTEMDLDNKVRVNSYDSAAGETPDNGYGASDNAGDIVSTGEVKLNSGNVKVGGNVTAGGEVEIDSSSAKINGDVLCTEGNHDCVEPDDESQVDGEVRNTDRTVPEPSPVGDLVDDKLRDLEARNDNDGTAAIESGRLDWRGTDTVTLAAGRYYLKEVEMADTGNQELVVDTADGDVELAVDGDLHLDGTTISVEGDGVLRVFANAGDEGGDVDLDNGATVRVLDGAGSRTYNATQVWLYGPPDVDVDVQSDSEFTGVLYAPGSADSDGDVEVVGAEVSGAIVAQVSSMDEDNKAARIHYDEALSEAQVVDDADADDPRVTFMHITVNEVAVET